ncbi:MAG: cytochrome c3 family protein [Geobacteraceae bacterium]|nr:cytochrome c3 family protein [Geobacteraceae bacterium]
MKMQITILGLIFTALICGNACAVGPGKVLEFKGSPMGTVIFDGTVHKNAGLTCSDCHNPVMFPKMKQGTVKITMNDLYAGKYCGRCHNGKKAFLIKENCTRCHHKTESK